jgi:hypothetical protein
MRNHNLIDLGKIDTDFPQIFGQSPRGRKEIPGSRVD